MADEEAKQAEYVNHLCQLGEQPHAVLAAALRLDPEQIFEAQTQDPLLMTVSHWVSEGRPPTKPELKGALPHHHRLYLNWRADPLLVAPQLTMRSVLPSTWRPPGWP